MNRVVSPTGITYEEYPITFIRRVMTAEERPQFDHLLQQYRAYCLSPGQRCPLVTVDMCIVYLDEHDHAYVPLGLFDKKRMTVAGHEERLVGAVISGGHVEARDDVDLVSAALREIKEEFHIVDFVVTLTPVAEFTYLDADPRNRILTHLFVGVTRQRPKPTNELQQVSLIKLQQLEQIVNDPQSKVPFPDGKEYDLILGHRDKIFFALRYLRHMQSQLGLH